MASGVDIAVIGMAGRFPGAPTVEALWANVEAGRESLTTFTAEQLAAAGVAPAEFQRDTYVPVRGVLDGVDRFDASLFGYPAREAQLIDPQQRLLLQCAWEALEVAGYGDQPGQVGVFVGTTVSTYLLRYLIHRTDVAEGLGLLPVLLGNDKEHAATRIAYKLGLSGPALALQTACSTSLVAIHYAAQSILHGECDMALAGGASIQLPQETGYHYLRHGIMSPDGHCRAFDRQAAGTVAGNGVGVVLLKRATDAIRDGDCVHAVIRGSAVNNDAAEKAGYSAPSVSGQAAVITRALRAAGLSAEDISYVETHGTGTELGDGIEVAALTRAFRETTDRAGFCGIGSLKPNIGHLDAAAGVASFIKAVLALKHRVLPPSIHCAEPNPALNWAQTPFFVNREARPWRSDQAPRRCGVSSFGIGGTNAHVILEEAPALRPRSEAAAVPVIVVQSANTAEALESLGASLAERVATSRLPLADTAYTLQVGRRALPWRRAVVVDSSAHLSRALAEAPARRAARAPSLVFQFPGQGSQYAGMAAGPYRRIPAFTAALDRCLALMPRALRDELRPLLVAEAPTPADHDALADTRLAQPALFATQVALVEVLRGWGVRAKALIGHSVGEYTAAWLAEAVSLEDAVRLVVARAEVMSRALPGAMAALFADEAAVAACPVPVEVAAYNAPALTVVGGGTDEIEAATAWFEQRGTRVSRLKVSHAFHTHRMDGAAAEFREVARRVTFARPRIPIMSNVTGDHLNRRTGYTADYWADHLRQAVRFRQGMARLLAMPHPLVLEVGAGQTLTSLALQQRGAEEAVFVPTTPAVQDRTSDPLATLLRSVAAVWAHGGSVDWQAVNAGQRPVRVPLPTYPFAGERHWVGPPAGAAAEFASPAAGPATTVVDDAGATGTGTDAHTGTGTDAHTGTTPGQSGQPGDDVTDGLAAIWRRLLGAETITGDSDFFQLGGHSLLAVPLLVAVREAFGVALTLEETYQARSLRDQAALISHRRRRAL